jgi:hypothetical protein
VRGASATSSGLQLFPLMAGLLIASIGSGQVISRTGRYWIFPVAGMAVVTGGMALLSQLDQHTSTFVASLYQIVLGLGLGLVMQVLVLVVQSSVDLHDLGAATSAASFFRSIGGSVGVSVFATIFNSSLDHHLSRLLPTGAAAQGSTAESLHGSPAELAKLPPAVHSAYIESFVQSLQTVFEVAIFFAAAGFVISFALPRITLRGTTGGEAEANAGGLSAVGEQFGLVATGAAAVHQEIRIRLLAANAATERIDELARSGALSPASAQNLRRLYRARLSDLTAGDAQVNQGEDGGTPDEPRAATWRAVLDALHSERQALAAVAPLSDGGDPLVRARAERDQRVAALRAAAGRVSGERHQRMPDQDRAALQSLIADRISYLQGIDGATVGVDGSDADTGGIWLAVADVLATERQAMVALEPALTPDSGARLDRDDASERAVLAGR